MGYIFIYSSAIMSWRSIKRTMIITSSNYLEILSIHEANHGCVWLRSMIQHIRESCRLPSIKDNIIKLHEDNPICIIQIR